jgi:hypothetical protein
LTLPPVTANDELLTVTAAFSWIETSPLLTVALDPVKSNVELPAMINSSPADTNRLLCLLINKLLPCENVHWAATSITTDPPVMLTKLFVNELTVDPVSDALPPVTSNDDDANDTCTASVAAKLPPEIAINDESCTDN